MTTVATDTYKERSVADGSSWWACAEPERPTDARVVWHPNCPPCHLKAHAVGMSNGDREVPALASVLRLTLPPADPCLHCGTS